MKFYRPDPIRLWLVGGAETALRRATSVALGVIDTGIFHRLWAGGAFDKAWEAKVKEGLCLKHWGKAEEPL